MAFLVAIVANIQIPLDFEDAERVKEDKPS